MFRKSMSIVALVAVFSLSLTASEAQARNRYRSYSSRSYNGRVHRTYRYNSRSYNNGDRYGCYGNYSGYGNYHQYGGNRSGYSNYGNSSRNGFSIGIGNRGYGNFRYYGF